MSLFSYAQNFEDVLLWRALKNIANGVYLDIGAQDPISDSVSKLFYDQGWRGVHVEANTQYARQLRQDRPDEIVINSACLDKPGVVKFYEVPETGMSTASSEISQGLSDQGWTVTPTLVSAVTLDQIFEQIESPEIHWMKIDVEGVEKAVLEGWRDSPHRPWIVVIEAISPQDHASTHDAWEPLLLSKGYAYAHFDGLNRYYLSDAHADLMEHFAYGPSLWDEFQVPAIGRPARELVARHQAELSKAEADIAATNDALNGARGALTEAHLELDQVRGALGGTRSELDQVQSVLEKTRSELDQTRGALDERRDALDRALTGLAEAQKEHQRTLAELNQAQGARRQIQVELDHARQQISRTQETLDRARADVARLAAELRSVTETVWWRISTPFHRRSTQAAHAAWSRALNGDPLEGPLADLLRLEGEAFVRRAYVLLLGREADPEGLRAHLRTLDQNGDREAIIVAMATSDEARRAGIDLPGLAALIANHRSPRTFSLRRLLRRLTLSPDRRACADDDSPSSLKNLLSLHDAAFVHAIYAAVLMREAEPQGFSDHLGALREGVSRATLIARMRLSEEGRRLAPQLPGLDTLARLYLRRQKPIAGSLMRLADAGPRRQRRKRRISALETRVSLLGLRERPRVVVQAPLAPAVVAASTARVPAPRLAPVAADPKSVRTHIPEPIAKGPTSSWRFESLADQAVDAPVEHELAQALIDLGDRVADEFAPGETAVDVLIGGQPPVGGAASRTPPLLMGFDWGESGYPLGEIDSINETLGGVACASSHACKVLADHGVDIPLAPVGLGVDHWERIAAAPDYRAPGRKFRFLHVSACGLDQGVDLMLEAYGRVFDSDDAVSLLIVPTGASRRELETRLERLRLNRRFPDVVVIDPLLDQAQLKSLYAQCNVVLAPSRAEGFALPVALGLMSGLPVIATAWGGHMDYCDAENSWLVDYDFQRAKTGSGLVASLWAEPRASLLEEALSDAYHATPEERAAKAAAGREKLLARFTWAHVAGRVSKLAAQVEARKAAAPKKPTVAWLSTWNVKCGVASHVSHLLGAVPEEDVVIFAGREQPRIGEDGPNCLRPWVPGKGANELSQVTRELSARSIHNLVLHYNYGFFNHFELNTFLETVARRGVRVFIDMHSTIDPMDEDNWRLRDFLGGLRSCHRILAHGPADMNRLKALGLVDNVMLFPLGVVAKANGRDASRRPDETPLITSFGFAFANKGLVELVEAVGLLKAQGQQVRLRMLNAEHINPASGAVVRAIQAAVKRLDLQDDIELRTEYLEDDECLALLGEADLVVNPYQETGESASAAVRYGITSGAPVTVTPLPIFDDLGGAVFRMSGTTPKDIADGIAYALRQIKEGSQEAKDVQAAARQWIETHDVARQGVRLMRSAQTFTRQPELAPADSRSL